MSKLNQPVISFDKNGSRYTLAAENARGDFNWLFLPGGPGADSSYFKLLLEHITLPGKIWLIDFPGNGNNVEAPNCADFNFEKWDKCFLDTVKRFDKPILVGHSFGAMFPLLFPEVEALISGFVILNSAPCLWLEAASKIAQENNVQALRDDVLKFHDIPNQETFDTALMACLPYYFPVGNLEKGKALLANLPFNYHAAVWWLRKAHEINYTAQWVPQEIPTMILGSSHDFITPSHLYENDQRFKRDNVVLHKIQNAGHFPWIEQPEEVIKVFSEFTSRLAAHA